MKYFKNLLLLALFTGLFTACSNDDDSNDPEPVNEEEVITTVIATLTDPDGNVVTLTSRDLDGDGPNAPDVNISGNFSANTLYTGAVVFLNETETPAEDITEEVNEEANEHQVFFIPSGQLGITFAYENFDGAGNPLGTLFSATTGDPSTGNINITLRHEPKKPNDGTLADAGGETDIAVNFQVTVE